MNVELDPEEAVRYAAMELAIQWSRLLDMQFKANNITSKHDDAAMQERAAAMENWLRYGNVNGPPSDDEEFDDD